MDKHRKQMPPSWMMNSFHGYRDGGEGECDSVAVPGYSLLRHSSSPHPLQAVRSLPPSHTALQGETVAQGNHQWVGTGGDDWLQNGGRICESVCHARDLYNTSFFSRTYTHMMW